MQTKLEEHPLKKFKCPVSKIVYLNRFEHQRKCIYTFCKRGWTWTKGLYPS